MKNTDWSEATINKNEAIRSLISCRESGRKSCFIDIRDNKEVAFPLNVKNPKLNNPFNWVMAYGTINPSTQERFFNKTEEDLFYNYTQLYSTKKARDIYIKTGNITKGLNKGIGIATPVKVNDANETREDGYVYSGQCYKWQPLRGIEYRVPSPDVKKVYVIVTEDREMSDNVFYKMLTNFINSKGI